MKFSLDKILKIYASTDRHYHTWQHISQMLNNCSLLSEEELTKSQKLAIIFHDVVYDVTKKDNEKQSAEFMVKTVKTIDAEEERIVSIARDIILDTSNSQAINCPEFSPLVIDLDLADLASNWEVYLNFVNLIRDEYVSFSEEEWVKGRKYFLSRMLRRQFIFLTEGGKSLFEKQARDNMEKEYRELTGRF